MAFRKNFRGRRYPRSRLPRAKLAKVRRTWLTSFNATTCNALDIVGKDCETGPTQLRFILIDNDTLEDGFSDSATCRRILGDLWFSPTWDDTVVDDCNNNFLAVISSYFQMFVGLIKYQTNAADEILNYNPIFSDFDLSEAKWLKTWQHIWTPAAEINFIEPYNVAGCAAYVCPDTHTTGLLDNNFVNGTGTINIETDCSDPVTISCEAAQGAHCNQSAKYPIPWHVHFDIKKNIKLTENNGLAFDVDFLMPNAALLVNPRVQVFGNIRCQVEF